MLDRKVIYEFGDTMRSGPEQTIGLLRLYPALVTANLSFPGDEPGGVGDYAVHHAAYYSPPVVLEYLMACGANIHARTDELETPLHFAATSDNVQAINLLLDAGADIEAAMIDGRTPIDLCTKGQRAAFETLLACGADAGMLAPVAWKRVDLIELALATRTLEDMRRRVPEEHILLMLASFYDDGDAMFERLRTAGFRE